MQSRMQSRNFGNIKLQNVGNYVKIDTDSLWRLNSGKKPQYDAEI